MPLNRTDRVAVCSRSFSLNATLRGELLERFANVTFNDAGVKLEGSRLVAFLRGHEQAIIGLEQITDEILSELPELRVISKYGVGLDMIDVAAIRSRGKRLGWVGGVNRRSVAELALSFAISMLHGVTTANREVLNGRWRQLQGGQLSGRTVGIIGCGNIGKDLVQLLKPFACPILVHDIRDYPAFYAEHDVTPVALEPLLAAADVVTLHVPLDASTRGMLDRRRLSLMRKSAILVNTARGGLVDEAAVREMLSDGGLAGAAFDVFDSEPPDDQALLSLPNFLGTPHIGGSAIEAVLAMGRSAIEQLDR